MCGILGRGHKLYNLLQFECGAKLLGMGSLLVFTFLDHKKALQQDHLLALFANICVMEIPSHCPVITNAS